MHTNDAVRLRLQCIRLSPLPMAEERCSTLPLRTVFNTQNSWRRTAPRFPAPEFGHSLDGYFATRHGADALRNGVCHSLDVTVGGLVDYKCLCHGVSLSGSARKSVYDAPLDQSQNLLYRYSFS
jgi:hypothetical protein